MITALLKIALGISVLLTLTVVMIRAQPQDDSALSDLLTPPEDCRDLCLLGIRPGQTTVGQALTQLRAHLWVSSAYLDAPGRGYGDITWEWSGQQPGLVDAARPGRATFYWERSDDNNGRMLADMPIETVSIQTHIRMYQAQRWFGQPDTGTAAYHPDSNVGYSTAYNSLYGMIDLSTVLPCPANWLTYWDARVKITLSQWRGASAYVPPPDLMNMC